MTLWSLPVVVLVAASHIHASVQEKDLRVALADAQRRWEERTPSSYEFTVEVRCFCVGIEMTPPTFRVTRGEPAATRELSAASEKLYGSFNTVEKLFKALERSLSRGQYKSTVQYDEELGFPVKADLDPQRRVKDEELYFRVTRFRVIER